MIHPYCTACLRVVSIPPIVREHLCPLTTVTYEGYFLPSFSLPPDSSYHLFLSLSLSLSNLHRSRTRRFTKIPIFSFSRCIIIIVDLNLVSKMLVTSIGCIDSSNSSPTAAPPIFLLPRKTGRREESKRRPAWHDANGRVIYPVETARKFLFLGASPR